MASTSSRSTRKGKQKARAVKPVARRSSENPAINYKFHLMLADILQKEGVTLKELDEKLNKNLDETAPDRFQRDQLHHKMRVGKTLQAARRKTKNKHYLMSYLLDRWSRVTGGHRKPYVLKKMFKDTPQIGTAIEKLCKLQLKCDWSRCGKQTPVQLEINSEGTLCTICRDCENARKKSKRKCPTKSVTQEKIQSLLREIPDSVTTRKRSLTSSDKLSDSDDESTPSPKKRKVDTSSTSEESEVETDHREVKEKEEDKDSPSMKDTAEYKAIIKHTVELRTAVKNNITTLSGHLLCNQLITSENEEELRIISQSESDRAAKLVGFVQHRVELNPDNFCTFIKILEKDEKNYEYIINLLKETCDSLKKGCSRDHHSRSLEVAVEKENFMGWISDHISETDCATLKGTIPSLRELQILRGQNGMTVRVVETAAHSWKAVAMALGFSGAQIRTIERDYLNRSEDACREVFIKWLDGEADVSSPLTWDTLIERLEEARLDDLSENVKQCLGHYQ